MPNHNKKALEKLLASIEEVFWVELDEPTRKAIVLHVLNHVGVTLESEPLAWGTKVRHLNGNVGLVLQGPDEDGSYMVVYEGEVRAELSIGANLEPVQ